MKQYQRTTKTFHIISLNTNRPMKIRARVLGQTQTFGFVKPVNGKLTLIVKQRENGNKSITNKIDNPYKTMAHPPIPPSPSVIKTVKSHERRKDWIVIKTNGTYPWSFMTPKYCND
jgi:FMN phosphatase YigB (HAD superfamily)